MKAGELLLRGPYLAAIVAEIAARGVDVGAWLEGHGLARAAVDAPEVAFDLPGFRALVLDAVHVSGEPAFGLFVGQRLHAELHGLLGRAALVSTSIRQALELVEAHVEVSFPLVAIAVSPRPDGGVRVTLRDRHPLGAARRPVHEAVLLALANVLETMARGASRIHDVELAFADPGYGTLARELLGSAVRYGRATTGFVLPAEALAAPLRRSDPLAFRAAAASLARAQTRLDGTTTAARLRRLFLDAAGALPSRIVAARRLLVSPRTLDRRLTAEGTSYRAEIERVRHDLARAYLRAEELGIEEIAFMLGYSDLPNFRRAFRRWEGMPPSRFRALAGAKTRRR